MPQVSFISGTSVTLNGYLASMGTASSVNVSFEYGTTSNSNTPGITLVTAMTATGAFSINLTGLLQNTTYYFAAYANGALHGTATGAFMYFTTSFNSTIVNVNTNSATGVSYFSATLNGTLISIGTATSVNVYFNYGTTTSYGTTIAASTPTMTATGGFNVNITGLQPNTNYHFMVYADGGISGIATGTDMTFTTLADITSHR